MILTRSSEIWVPKLTDHRIRWTLKRSGWIYDPWGWNRLQLGYWWRNSDGTIYSLFWHAPGINRRTLEQRGYEVLFEFPRRKK